MSQPSIEPQSKMKYGILSTVRVKYLVGANNAKLSQAYFTRTQKLKSAGWKRRKNSRSHE